jgi:protein-tyrosine sulfotransferase
MAHDLDAPSNQPPPARARRPRLKHVFVVSLARSGSTLLRYLLDAHPQIVSPAELNLSTLLLHAADTWHRAHEGLGRTDPGATEETAAGDQGAARTALSPEALRWATQIVNQLTADLARAAGASVFVDKSLTTIDQLPIVARCYPKARYIFLYRYPLDMIASGIEASRWGFSSFGFAPYIGSTPGNFVAGLGNYWIDKVARMLEFERTCHVPYARIYYELLCDDPDTTVSDLLAFIGVPPAEGLVEKAFESRHAVGPGDYKIDFTRSVGSDSVGRGSTLPNLLRPDQINRMNELLAELDYPSIEAAREGSLAALLGLARSTHGTVVTAAELTRQLTERLSAGLARRGGAEPGPAFELLVRDEAGAERVIVVAGGQVAVADAPRTDVGEPAVARLVCHGDALLRVASGERNLAQVLHDGLVRIDRNGAATGRLRANLDLLSGLDRLLRPPG